MSQLKLFIKCIMRTETKYKISEEVLSNHAIPGYSFVSQPSLSNAGGAGFFVSDKLNFTVRDDLSESTPDYECLWIEVQSDSKDDLICGVIYRHPHSNFEAFMAYLDIVMDKISRERKYCVMMGDFSLNLLNADSHPGTNEFLNTLGSYFFNPHILQPTRITHHTATLIDNVFLNSIYHHTISGNILYDLTDHLPNFLIINKFSTLPKGFKIFKRDFSLFNEQNFLQEMQSVNWNLESLDDNVNEMFDTFNSELMKIIDKHIPLKQLSRKDVKHRSKPWITSGIRTSLKIKNNLYKKYIKSRTVYYHQKFKLYRNKINRLIKISKKDYYNKYFMSNKSNMKNIWKGIKQIINSKPRGSSSSPSKILEGENVLTDSKSIANAFNNFFANIGNNLATSIPSVEATPMDSMSNQQLNSIFLNQITSEEIILEINKLNSSKAVGPFSIPINILKLTKDVISKPLEIIFNSSLLNGIVPDSFKIARIIPIHKKGQR